VSTPFLILLRIILEEQRHPVAQGFYRILRGRIRAKSSAANGNGAADHADTGCDRIKAPAPPAGEATAQTPSGGEGRSNRPAVDTPDVDNGGEQQLGAATATRARRTARRKELLDSDRRHRGGSGGTNVVLTAVQESPATEAQIFDRVFWM
jgi:hypothetical protein